MVLLQPQCGVLWVQVSTFVPIVLPWFCSCVYPRELFVFVARYSGMAVEGRLGSNPLFSSCGTIFLLSRYFTRVTTRNQSSGHITIHLARHTSIELLCCSVQASFRAVPPFPVCRHTWREVYRALPHDRHPKRVTMSFSPGRYETSHKALDLLTCFVLTDFTLELLSFTPLVRARSASHPPLTHITTSFPVGCYEMLYNDDDAGARSPLAGRGMWTDVALLNGVTRPSR